MEYSPEENKTGAPKNFVIRCPKCRWSRISSGLKEDIADLKEVHTGCPTCGKWRKFKCLRCGTNAIMKKLTKGT